MSRNSIEMGLAPPSSDVSPTREGQISRFSRIHAVKHTQHTGDRVYLFWRVAVDAHAKSNCMHTKLG